MRKSKRVIDRLVAIGGFLFIAFLFVSVIRNDFVPNISSLLPKAEVNKSTSFANAKEELHEEVFSLSTQVIQPQTVGSVLGQAACKYSALGIECRDYYNQDQKASNISDFSQISYQQNNIIATQGSVGATGVCAIPDASNPIQAYTVGSGSSSTVTFSSTFGFGPGDYVRINKEGPYQIRYIYPKKTYVTLDKVVNWSSGQLIEKVRFLDGKARAGIAMQILEPLYVPSYQLKGNQGKPIIKGDGTTSQGAKLDDPKRIRPDNQLAFMTSDPINARTACTYGVQPPSGDQGPFYFELGCAKGGVRQPGEDPANFSKLFDSSPEKKQKQNLIAYKVTFGSTPDTLNNDDISDKMKPKLVDTTNFWAFDNPSIRSSEEANSQNIDIQVSDYVRSINAPSDENRPAGEASILDQTLNRAKAGVEVPINTTQDKEALANFLADNVYTFASEDVKRSQGIPLSYTSADNKQEGNKQEGTLCSVSENSDKTKCPIVEATYSCSGLFGSTYVNAEVKLGFMGVSLVADDPLQGSTQRTHVSAFNGVTAAFDAPSGIIKKASANDLLKAANGNHVDQTCRDLLANAPTSLSDAETKELQDMFKRTNDNEFTQFESISPSIYIVSGARANFSGYLKGFNGFVFGNPIWLNIDKDKDNKDLKIYYVSQFPVRQLRDSAKWDGPNEQFNAIAKAYQDSILKQNGLVKTDFVIKCTSNPNSTSSQPILDLSMEFKNVN